MLDLQNQLILCPYLVEEFYNGFSKFDIFDDLKNFILKFGGGGGHTIHLHVGTISIITSIIQAMGITFPNL